VGQVFYLGTKYSKLMDCSFLDEEGKTQPAEMGCYGIGVGRTMAAAIEQNHDENGIVWPVPIAPWEVAVLPLQLNDEAVVEAAETIYEGFRMAGIETVIDDRNERAGFKFKDADLIGYPVQVVLGGRSVAAGKAEVKFRASGEKTEMPLDEVVIVIRDWILERRRGEA
jgi:prolyl-tRNA synthetase